MAIADGLRERSRAHPRAVTAVVSIVGYAVVIAAFAQLLPLPTLGRDAVLLFSDAIAVINAAALTSLLAGVWFITHDQVDRHRRAMLTAFSLILLFLAVYVWKQSGGFTKEFVVSEGQFLAAHATVITYAYWAMLAVHVVLSILAVPVVVHAVVLGLTHSPDELPETAHPRVGRVAVAAWSLSLALGIVTYLMLNHVYGWEVLRESALLVVGCAGPSARGLTRRRGPNDGP